MRGDRLGKEIGSQKSCNIMQEQVIMCNNNFVIKEVEKMKMRNILTKVRGIAKCSADPSVSIY
jgi:hypothetical protein